MNDSLVPALVRFIRSVAVLALPAEGQERWLNSFGLPGEAAIADELAQEFDDRFLLLPQFVELGWIPENVAEQLRELNSLLAAMSGPENAHIWEISALGTNDVWDKVRNHATNILLAI
jgi:hypothetical protein